MTPDQACSLAVRIGQYWPQRNGISTEVWERKLVRFDYEYARAAFERMTETLRHPPVIADFIAEYRPPKRDRIECPICDGGGWVPVTDHRRHAAHCPQTSECGCHAVEPCSCSAGDEMRPGYERILAHRPPARTTTPHANPQENP